MTIGRQASSNEEAIKARAYALWENEGRPEGRHLDHWLRASEAFGESDTAAALSKPAAASSNDARRPARRTSKPRAEQVGESETAAAPSKSAAAPGHGARQPAPRPTKPRANAAAE